ncbi:TPA: hypothetical protein ACPSKY_002571 [Legionella bozemanae]
MKVTENSKMFHPKLLVSVKKMPDIYPGFTQSSIRWLIFNENTNGFKRCVKRIGKKILIDLEQFESWIDSQGGQA